MSGGGHRGLLPDYVVTRFRVRGAITLPGEPLGEEALTTYIHEAAHHLNARHGRDFHSEVERLAGRAARLMLTEGEEVRKRWPELYVG